MFEYELDEPMALYGGIPIVLSHTAKTSAAAFWFNPTETFVDIEQDQMGAHSHWISESGVVDLMLIPGPKPFDVIQKFTRLVGADENCSPCVTWSPFPVTQYAVLAAL